MLGTRLYMESVYRCCLHCIVSGTFQVCMLSMRDLQLKPKIKLFLVQHHWLGCKAWPSRLLYMHNYVAYNTYNVCVSAYWLPVSPFSITRNRCVCGHLCVSCQLPSLNHMIVESGLSSSISSLP